ncbi:MAG: SUMF1/EgtB/PvdO family nonheme iron enzyme [Planctomycetes bacterium]|nr:SUMF1/EgtB/PvdO family nonheme iron enzyme [Planctomycetota bacterium]
MQIERLAFVPPARVALSSKLEVSVDAALLVSSFEVTRGEWRAWALERGGESAARMREAGWDSASDTWPADYVSLEDSREYARAQGMRLPSASEWLAIACGSSAASYPWGPNDAASVANTLELGLRHPTPVGTFEQGRSPLGIYDLLGNAWEWVDAPPGKGDATIVRGPWAWAMGGSYLTLRHPLFDPRSDESGTLHLEIDERGRSNEIGLRLVANARAWLLAHAADFADIPAAQARLTAVGRRWGPAASALLEELARAYPDVRVFAWLSAGAHR